MSPIEIGAELAQADELAAKATSKLAMEAGRREHCLLRLVLTANLIDGVYRTTITVRARLTNFGKT